LFQRRQAVGSGKKSYSSIHPCRMGW